MDSTSPSDDGRCCAYGETRLAQGDTLAAALAFQTVAARPDASDSDQRDGPRPARRRIGLTPMSGAPAAEREPDDRSSQDRCRTGAHRTRRVRRAALAPR